MRRCLGSRNAKSAAFVAGSIVLKSNVVQLEKCIFVIVGCGHGTTVECGMVVLEVGVGEGDALFGAGDGDGYSFELVFSTQLVGTDQCDIVSGIECIAWDG